MKIQGIKAAFEIQTEKRSWLFACQTEKDKENWLKELKQAKKEIQKKQFASTYGNLLFYEFSMTFDRWKERR